MAFTAIAVRWHMDGRFPCGGIALVARIAVIHDALVVKISTGKGGGVVTHRAILRRRNVICGFSASRDAMT